MSKIKLAILASGSGTNAEAIVKYFADHDQIEIEVIMSNKPDAYVLERAKKLGIEALCFNREEFYANQSILGALEQRSIDFIILAGFLWLIPTQLINSFPEKIINIHPSLLPKHGGKGMYGGRVHQTVIDRGEHESGITIHLVDEIYDNGRILKQEKVKVHTADTADILAGKIHAIEHLHYPKTIEQYVLGKL